MAKNRAYALLVASIGQMAALSIGAHAATIEYKPINGYFDIAETSSAGHTGLAQSFLALDNYISIGFYLFSYNAPEQVRFTLLAGDGLSGQVLSTKTLTSAPYSWDTSTYLVSASFLDVPLVVGNPYTIKLTTTYGAPPEGGYSKAKAMIAGGYEGNPNPYAGGKLYLIGAAANQFYGKYYDLAFKMTGISAVPEPASWGLMIAGIAGAGATLRNRRRKTEALKLA